MREILLNRSWAEVDLDSIGHNTRLLRSRVRRGSELMGVVKADAYGHGIKEIIPVLIENGVTRLAVSMLDEAIELRKYGVTIPILVLSYTDPRRAEEIIEYHITQTVFSNELAMSLSIAGQKAGREVRIHIKVDTGMGRVGFMAGFEAVKNIKEIQAMPWIVIEGIYTHFSSADEEDESYTVMQFEQFMGICNELGRIGIQIPIKHVCNSAAALRFPAMHLDMVRIGILLYGMSPSSYCNASSYGFLPAMSLKTNIILVKEMEKNHSISYGRTFTTARKSLVATIPIGYADGYSRCLSNKASVLIHSRRCPVVGNICMDTCMVDLTDIHELRCEKIGDVKAVEVTVGDLKIGDIKAVDIETSDVKTDNVKVDVRKTGDVKVVDIETSDVKTDDLKVDDEKICDVMAGNLKAIDVKVGDEVVLFGKQGEALLDIDEIAALMNTINYEVTCIVGKRVPRAYIRNGQLVDVKNYLLGD